MEVPVVPSPAAVALPAPCKRADCPCPASWNGMPDEYCGRTCQSGRPCSVAVHLVPSHPTRVCQAVMTDVALAAQRGLSVAPVVTTHVHVPVMSSAQTVSTASPAYAPAVTTDTPPVVVVAKVAFIVRGAAGREASVLCFKRTGITGLDQLDIPGGKMEPRDDQQIKVCLRRELGEELDTPPAWRRIMNDAMASPGHHALEANLGELHSITVWGVVLPVDLVLGPDYIPRLREKDKHWSLEWRPVSQLVSSIEASHLPSYSAAVRKACLSALDLRLSLGRHRQGHLHC